MKNLMTFEGAGFRLTDLYTKRLCGNIGDENNGRFVVPFRENRKRSCLRVVASAGDGWDHVSVSLGHRCPTWHELEYIKRMFFEPDEIAFQLHMPPSDHISIHPYCLHLWRPHEEIIPVPPRFMV